MTSAELQMVLSCVSQMLQEQRIPVAAHGVAVSGTRSTVDDPSSQAEVGRSRSLSGKTAAIWLNDSDSWFSHIGVVAATTAIGDCYAPRGNERTVMIPTETSPIALFMHGADDIPGNVLPGERGICHRSASGAIDAYVKLVNDSVTPGDGLGSLLALLGAYGSFGTAGGLTVTLDDSVDAVTIAAKNGAMAVFNDQASTVELAGSVGTANDGLVRKSDLQAAIAALAAIVQGGTGVTPQWRRRQRNLSALK